MRSPPTHRRSDHPDIGDWGRSEFSNAVDSIRMALIDEAWFGRSAISQDHHNDHSLGWERKDAGQGREKGQSPNGQAAADEQQLRTVHDDPRELDFDR